MKSLAEVMDNLQKRADEARKQEATTTNTKESSTKYDCPKCQDRGYIIDGWYAKECSCLEQQKMSRRFSNAMIPDEFENARLDTYEIAYSTQRTLYDAMNAYLAAFEEIKDKKINSLGFIARFGEKRLKELKQSSQRAEAKRKHNNFGLGKTHLQVAAAKELMKLGYPVLVVSDVVLMGDLSKTRGYEDGSEQFNSLLGSVINAPVLVWDDIGKAKTTSFRMDMYYQIIDERYRKNRPILYSSNEDKDTLTEQIGDAAASRLFGMSKGWIYAVEGYDYRMKGA